MAHRIFLAIPIQEDLQQQIREWCQQFSRLPMRWIPQKNLHITLVPPWKEEDIEKVKESLLPFARATVPFQIEFTNVTYGPNMRQPRLIWAEGKTPSQLLLLKEKLDATLKIGSDTRPFRLHLTLARFQPHTFPSFPVKTFNEHVAWKQMCDSFVLFESHLLPDGAKYEILQTYPFV